MKHVIELHAHLSGYLLACNAGTGNMDIAGGDAWPVAGSVVHNVCVCDLFSHIFHLPAMGD